MFDYLKDVLLLRAQGPPAIHFAMRFQQLTGPVMAKGVEDTAIYRYHRLVALNEVGCDPARFGASIEEFHAHNTGMLAALPLTMTTTTTHDTKRSEDVRARIAVLSEIPDDWERRVSPWIEATRRTGATANDLYLLFQTAVGAWPITGEDPALRDRLGAYMAKAIREAKLETSWTRPDERYEAAVAQAVAALFEDAKLRDDVAGLARTLAPYGACNSLAQLALKLASPGVPDTYQGGELWDLSLVDPDNRRPVDYGRRREMLAELTKRGDASPDLARELVEAYPDGRIKLHVTQTGLAMRRADGLLFLEGAYRPIDAGDHVVAFERSRGSTRLVCVAPRLARTLTSGTRLWPLGDAWGDRSIEVGDAASWRNAFTGERFHGARIALCDLFAVFPVAWLAAGNT